MNSPNQFATKKACPVNRGLQPSQLGSSAYSASARHSPSQVAVSENFHIFHHLQLNKMGKDHLGKQHKRSGHREAPKSENVYLALLVKLYSFLARMYIIPQDQFKYLESI